MHETTDQEHARLRVACMKEDVILIQKLSKQIPIDSFNGLALRICAFHGKLNSMRTLLELGASKPENLVKTSKKYFFIWTDKIKKG